MDVIEAHKMLMQLWPNGIPKGAYPVVAGMLVVGRASQDLVESPLREHFVKGLARGLAAEAPKRVSKPRRAALLPEPAKIIPPLSRKAPSKNVDRVYKHLAEFSGYAWSQKAMAAHLDLGLWTVKRALWQLVREGKVVRKAAPQGPHLYGVAK